MAAAHAQGVGHFLLAPVGVLAELFSDLGTERLVAERLQQLVCKGAQVLAQGRVGVDQRQVQIRDRDDQGVVDLLLNNLRLISSSIASR